MYTFTFSSYALCLDNFSAYFQAVVMIHAYILPQIWNDDDARNTIAINDFFLCVDTA